VEDFALLDVLWDTFELLPLLLLLSFFFSIKDFNCFVFDILIVFSIKKKKKKKKKNKDKIIFYNKILINKIHVNSIKEIINVNYM